MSDGSPPVRMMLVANAAGIAPQLRAAGYSPSILADTAAAWDEVQAGLPCVIVLQANHGECEALRLIGRLRAQDRLLPVGVVLLVDDASDESLNTIALGAGADECLFPPLSVAELLARVGRVFRQCAASAARQAAMLAEQGEGATSRSAQRFDSIGSWAYDVRTGQLHWSEAICEVFGITPAQFRGTLEHFLSFVLAEDLGALESARAKACAASPLYEIQYRILRPDGTIRWLGEKGSVFCDSGGAPLGRFAIVVDLTEQRRTHERLAERLALANIAGRVARLGAWTIDLPERKLTWSDENCAIHDVPPGYRPTLEEGLSLFAAEHREHVVRLVDACARDGTAYEFEVPKFTARGRSIWVRSIGEAVRDSTGRIVRLQGAFQDITERKRAEQELRQKDALLHIAGRVARIGGWAIEMSQRRIDWSDEVVDILEFRRDPPPRLSQFLRLANSEGRRRLATAIAHCGQTGTPFDLEAQVMTPRGSRISVRVIGEAEHDASGAVRRVQEIGRAHV